MFTIGQVSKMFGLPISTLRYYDKEGLLPNIERESGIRKFKDKDIEAIRIIECLKKSGLEIKQIKRFMQWCAEGSSTYPQRKELFETQKKRVEEEIGRMNRVLDMLKFKCWYYGEAIKNGNEDKLSPLPTSDMPSDVRKAYLNSHN